MKKFPVVLLAALASPAWSAGPAPAIDKLLECGDIASASERLACFDREAAPFRRKPAADSTPRAATAPTAVAPPAPPPAPPQAPAAPARPSLGQEQLPVRIDRAAAAEEATHARITALRRAGKSFVVELDNGQSWRHEDEHQGSFLAVGEAITIRRAALGSYRLTRDEGAARNWIRVTRIR